MKNCGRCGKPVYNPGQAICASCKKVITSDHGKQIDKENRKQDMYDKMREAMENPGEDDEKYDIDYWGLGEEDAKYRKRGRKR